MDYTTIESTMHEAVCRATTRLPPDVESALHDHSNDRSGLVFLIFWKA